MARYAIGDIQGCLDAFRELLLRLEFNPLQDELWLTGDLVNRGPKSVETLRYVRDLGTCVTVVLGNHDLHLLAVASGATKLRRRDTLSSVLEAMDRADLLDWLRWRPLFVLDAPRDTALVHAGLYPNWSVGKTLALAGEVEAVLRGSDYLRFLAQMYGDTPTRWHDDLSGIERLRFITNVFTRIRYCSVDGTVLDFQNKLAPSEKPPGLVPWFQCETRDRRSVRVVFGHWSTLGLWNADGVIGLDTGCVWGGQLSAVQLDCHPARFENVKCHPHRAPS
jgi:bis(5'-nucleosyl)-tetraphosphatase (symmetrical)